jgi:hypothetical protein
LNSIVNLFNQHPFWSTAILTWVSTTGVSAFISSLPAPTATSSPFYVFWFKFMNAVLAGNVSRATNTKVESSPNFQAAVNVQTTQAGVAPIVVTPVEPAKP